MGQKKSRMLRTPSVPDQAEAVTPNIPTPMVNSYRKSIDCCSCSISSDAEAASSFFYSARIAELSEQRSNFDNQLEFDVESSTPHWTETVPASDAQQAPEAEATLMTTFGSALQSGRTQQTNESVACQSGRTQQTNKSNTFPDSLLVKSVISASSEVPNIVVFEMLKEHVGRTQQTNKSNSFPDSPSVRSVASASSEVPNSLVFEMLKEHPEWGPFFRRQPYELEIGAKIAEGGQAEIFEAFGMTEHDERYMGNYEKVRLVLKVFKEGFPLDQLQRLWPPGIASAAIQYRYYRGTYLSPVQDHLCWALGVRLLDNGRFAFIFDRYWGDLRKRIDENMLKRNGCPPFDVWTTNKYIVSIARGMCNLHKLGILHNDLKAANVLLKDGYLGVVEVADFESSVGILGTGFWRAPEVLLALKNRNETFRQQTTQQTDVYSFAMTCYEIITGRMPFEGHDAWDYDIILRGERPKLPGGPYSTYNNLVTKCWHQDPQQRPSFAEVVQDLEALKLSSRPECDFERRYECHLRSLRDELERNYFHDKQTMHGSHWRHAVWI